MNDFWLKIYTTYPIYHRVRVVRALIGYCLFVGQSSFGRRPAIHGEKDRVVAYFVYNEESYLCSMKTGASPNNLFVNEREMHVEDFFKLFPTIPDFILWGVLYNHRPAAQGKRLEMDFREYSLKDQSIRQYRASLPQLSTNAAFLLGTGVSLSYGAVSWKEMCNKFKDGINAVVHVPSTDIEHIIGFMGEQYGIAQFLKDADEGIYCETLLKCVYGNPSKNNGSSSLKAIADIIAERSSLNETRSSLVVYSFNFDNYLESILAYELGLDVATDYSTATPRRKVGDEPFAHHAVCVKHIHGYFDRGREISKSQLESIVLTDIEYNKAYSSRRKTFTKHTLEKAIAGPLLIVGNSLSDYEERKLFENYYDDHQDHFAYALMYAGDYKDSWSLAYVTYALLRIGVIPIWANDYDDYPRIIKSLFENAGRSQNNTR